MKHFFNTISATNPELGLYEAAAKKQEDFILEIFKDKVGIWLTPFDVHGILQIRGKNHPITSTRRAITNLEQDGKLTKSAEASGIGLYGKPNYCWTLKISHEADSQLNLFSL